MGMAAILFNGTEPFKQVINTLLTEGPIWKLLKQEMSKICFLSPMICAKIRPQGLLGSGEEDF